MSGAVIIRLQNLPLEARSIDIRRFFEGLQIPDGGVHIIGGEKGDAFIAFQSDEDARLAMARDSLPLCNSRIKLYLSSKTEMQNVIAAARNQHLSATAAAAAAAQQQQTVAPKTTTLPSSIEQILFRSAQPVVAPAQVLSQQKGQQNPVELLSSLTKLFSSNAPPPQQPQQPQQPIVQQTSAANDPLKTLANLLPMIQQQQQQKPPTLNTSVPPPQIHSQQQSI
jgi:hypothetical protein